MIEPYSKYSMCYTNKLIMILLKKWETQFLFCNFNRLRDEWKLNLPSYVGVFKKKKKVDQYLYLDCGNGYITACIWQNSHNCTFKKVKLTAYKYSLLFLMKKRMSSMVKIINYLSLTKKDCLCFFRQNGTNLKLSPVSLKVRSPWPS